MLKKNIDIFVLSGQLGLSSARLRQWMNLNLAGDADGSPNSQDKLTDMEAESPSGYGKIANWVCKGDLT